MCTYDDGSNCFVIFCMPFLDRVTMHIERARSANGAFTRVLLVLN